MIVGSSTRLLTNSVRGSARSAACAACETAAQRSQQQQQQVVSPTFYA